jgi:hypothetical protein
MRCRVLRKLCKPYVWLSRLTQITNAEGGLIHESHTPGYFYPSDWWI